MPKKLLSSWKEIAAYAGYSERTVQRWERSAGFPVRRPGGKARSPVVALISEIDAWFVAAPTQAEFAENPNGIRGGLHPAPWPVHNSIQLAEETPPAVLHHSSHEVESASIPTVIPPPSSPVLEFRRLIKEQKACMDELKRAIARSVQLRQNMTPTQHWWPQGFNKMN
jgi:hypothetical protein